MVLVISESQQKPIKIVNTTVSLRNLCHSSTSVVISTRANNISANGLGLTELVVTNFRMSMSSVMDPASSGLSRPKSFQDHIPAASGDGDGNSLDNKQAATLDTSLQMTTGPGAGPIPAPFRSTSQYKQYPAPNSLPPNMTSSVSAPAISTAAASSDSPSSQNGDQIPRLFRSPTSKIETLKNWSISTYKCTKQLMFEKLGKSSRTVDSELEARIEHLRDLKRRYLQVLGLSRAFTSHFYHVIQTQQALAEVFSDLAQKSPELQQEFLYNAETQRNLQKNGEILLSALNFFLSSVNTLCNKTIEDTIITIRQYENSRIEYDAYRSDLELLLQVPKSDSTAAKIEESQRNFNLYKVTYEKLRDDVNIKLQFLDENRIKVMHKQLLLFHNAISAYFSGNQQSLEATLKQFSIKDSRHLS
ncbi:unnamed protein product [Allacma fusca]|uniref:AH domain-containing protein n=1 Tax=Allacma fusca TaxID=39272 RepID=A0A8J2M6W4_9HEXA|nr:unnamed protein product [Allacma fusca]